MPSTWDLMPNEQDLMPSGGNVILFYFHFPIVLQLVGVIFWLFSWSATQNCRTCLSEKWRIYISQVHGLKQTMDIPSHTFHRVQFNLYFFHLRCLRQSHVLDGGATNQSSLFPKQYPSDISQSNTAMIKQTKHYNLPRHTLPVHHYQKIAKPQDHHSRLNEH